MIIAWKHVIKREITNSKLWLEEHKKIIQKEFQLNEYHSEEFELAETIEECICNYSNWFHYKQIKHIDGVYVVKIIF